MSSFDEGKLRVALGDCFIPGQHRSVVTAALVRSATLERDADAPGASIAGVHPRYIAHVRLTAPGTDDALSAQLQAIVENRLLGLPEISRVDVTIVPPLFSILG